MNKIKFTNIAWAANTSPQAISNIISGNRRPSWELAKRLSRVTGLSTEAWMEGWVNRKCLNENLDLVIAALRSELLRKLCNGAYENQINKLKTKKGFEECSDGRCGAYQRQAEAKCAKIPVDRHKIKQLRQACGMDPDIFGLLINESGSTVFLWENGRSVPDTDTLEKICNIFHVNPGFFCGLTGEVPCAYAQGQPMQQGARL